MKDLFHLKVKHETHLCLHIHITKQEEMLKIISVYFYSLEGVDNKCLSFFFRSSEKALKKYYMTKSDNSFDWQFIDTPS